MLKIGDYALHQTTAQFGKVVGYGHQMVNGVYLPTLTVRIVGGTGINQGSFVEDLSSVWVQVEEGTIPKSLAQSSAVATS